jgi:hypothetical protein
MNDIFFRAPSGRKTENLWVLALVLALLVLAMVTAV